MKFDRICGILLALHAVPLSTTAQEEGTAWSVSLDTVAVLGQRYTSPIKQRADGSIIWDMQKLDDMPKILILPECYQEYRQTMNLEVA